MLFGSEDWMTALLDKGGRKVRAPRKHGAGQHPAEATSGTVPQKANRQSGKRPAIMAAGKGERVRQERTAFPATGMAGQTPPGARPNRGGASRRFFMRLDRQAFVSSSGSVARGVRQRTSQRNGRRPFGRVQNPAYRSSDPIARASQPLERVGRRSQASLLRACPEITASSCLSFLPPAALRLPRNISIFLGSLS